MAAPTKKVLLDFIENYPKPGSFEYRNFINNHGFDPINGITLDDYFKELIIKLPEYSKQLREIPFLQKKDGKIETDTANKILNLFNNAEFSAIAHKKLVTGRQETQSTPQSGKASDTSRTPTPPLVVPPITANPPITKTTVPSRRTQPARKTTQGEEQLITKNPQITRASSPQVTRRTIITSAPTPRISRVMPPRITRIPGRTIPGSSGVRRSQPTSIQQNPTIPKSPSLGNLIKPIVQGLGDGMGKAANSAANSLGRFNNRARNIKSSPAAKRILIAIIIFLLIIILIGGLGSLLNFLNPQALNQFEIKKSGDLSVGNDQEINYQIIVRNTASNSADLNTTTIDIIDRIATQTAFVRADQGGQEESTGSGTIIWRDQKFSGNSSKTVNLTVKPKPGQKDFWIENKAEIILKSVSVNAISGNFTGLLPNPLPPPVSNWTELKNSILDAINKYPENLDAYKKAAQAIGGAWEPLAGLHFVETGSDPQPIKSLVSGRPIGNLEPDIPISACGGPATEPGTPIPIGPGCGFATFLDSAIYAAKHLAGKIGRTPTTFQDVVTALSRYNGGGNSNCDENVPYSSDTNCPNKVVNKNDETVRAPLFYGEDDPYAMGLFDLAHSEMHIIFCGDRTRCSPLQPFNRPGAMAVVRALLEQK